MGTSYGAYIVDSPPFTLDLDDIRAHLPDGWTISDGRPSNREGLQEYTVSFTYQATNPIQAERQWKAEVTLHDDGSVFVYRGWYDFIYFLEWYRTYLSPEYKLMASLGVLTGRGNYTIMPGFTWDTIDRELENVGLKPEFARASAIERAAHFVPTCNRIC